MRKPTICICENKDADQLCSKCTADQRLCFRHMDITIPLLLISKVSSFKLFPVTIQPDCVGPGQKPHFWFSHETALMLLPLHDVHGSIEMFCNTHLIYRDFFFKI